MIIIGRVLIAKCRPYLFGYVFLKLIFVQSDIICTGPLNSPDNEDE